MKWEPQDQHPAEGGRIYVAQGPRTDRDLQDQIIRHLTDADLRSGNDDPDFLEGSEVERAKRFSHFLARRYYRDRLHRGFRYSTVLLGSEAAANLVDSPKFDGILERCTLGSFVTVRMVGELAVSELRAHRSDEWWTELLDYESAFLVQLATSEPTPVGLFHQHGISTLIREFQFRIPELLESLRNENVPVNLPRKPTTLLFSRTHHGRIYVVELDSAAAAVLRAINGSRNVAEIADCAALGQKETERILDDLIRISAVVPPLNEAA
jgi:hypothetical protein